MRGVRPWLALVALLAATAATGIYAKDAKDELVSENFDSFPEKGRAAWWLDPRAIEHTRLASLSLPQELHTLPRVPRSLDFDLVDLGSTDGAFGKDPYAADLAVRGTAGAITGYVSGIALVSFVPVEWIGARPGVKAPASPFEISSTITFTPGDEIALATLDGYEPILPGDEVVVLLRRAQRSFTPDGSGAWWPVAYRGTWHVNRGQATASAGIPWIDREAEAERPDEYAELLKWEEDNANVPVAELTRRLETTASDAGWLTGEALPQP